jgi:hypothetical protein
LFFSEARTGCFSKGVVEVTFVMMVPVKAGALPPNPSRLEILTIWAAHKDYTFISSLYNTTSLKNIIHESSLFIGPTPSPRARLAVAARERLLTDDTNHIFTASTGRGRSRARAVEVEGEGVAGEGEGEGEGEGADFSVELCLGWKTRSRDALCDVKGLERALASLQPIVPISSLEEEYRLLEGAGGDEELSALALLNTRKKHAEFVYDYEALCAGGGVYVCARLPEEHRPDDADAKQYFSVKMSIVKDTDPKQYCLVDMQQKKNDRTEIMVDPSEVLVPPTIKGGSKVNFIKGEPVLAIWPVDRSTAFYTADVVDLLPPNNKEKMVSVRFSWTEEDGEVVYETRAVKATRLVRQMTTPEDERRDDDVIADLAKEATEAQVSDDEDADDDDATQTTAATPLGRSTKRKKKQSPKKKDDQKKKKKRRRRENNTG